MAQIRYISPSLVLLLTISVIHTAWAEDTSKLLVPEGESPHKLNSLSKLNIDGLNILAISSKDLVAAGTENGAIIIWNSQTRRIVHYLRENLKKATDLAFNANGDILAIGTEIGEIGLFSSISGAMIKRIKINEVAITSLAFSASKDLLAIGYSNGDAQVLNIENDKIIAQTKAEKRAVSTITISNDGTAVLIGFSDGIARYWKLTDNSHIEIIHRAHTYHSIKKISLMNDGKTFVTLSANGSIKTWNTLNGKEIEIAPKSESENSNYETTHADTLSNDGLLYASCSETDNENVSVLTIKDLATGTVLRRIKECDHYTDMLRFDQTGATVAAFTSPNFSKFVGIFNISNGRVIQLNYDTPLEIRSVTFTPENEHLLLFHENGQISEVNIFNGHEKKIN